MKECTQKSIDDSVLTRTIVEHGSLETALCVEITYWKSKLRYVEYRLRQLLASTALSANEKEYLEECISEARNCYGHDSAKPSPAKLIYLRAMVGILTDFLKIATSQS